LQWLYDAGLVIRVPGISKPLIPLSAYEERAFKVYLLDVGLLGAMTGLNQKTIALGNELFTHFKGALIENYVMQELISHIQTKQSLLKIDSMQKYLKNMQKQIKTSF